MDDANQFRLLGQKRFLPFFLTQFAGAFNDNLFRNILLLLVAYTTGGLMGLPVDVVVNLATFLFILPFFLFSGMAGQIADKFDSALLIQRIKLAEILIMLAAATCLWIGWFHALLPLVFIMGLQSTFFGPIKYAILPRILSQGELVGGNALVETGTFIAILLGTLAAGVLMEAATPERVAAFAVLTLAIAGYLASLKVPGVAAGSPDLRINRNPLKETWHLIGLARERYAVFLAIMAISWFWFLGTAYLTQFPAFARDSLNGDTTVVTLLLAVFTVAVALGSMACERLSGHRVELGIVPIGSLGISLFGWDLYLHTPGNPMPTDWWLLLSTPDYRRIVIDLFGVGVFGGLFIVPLYAFVQREAPPAQRARVIAALNVINALFMVASTLTGMFMLGALNLTIPQFFLVLSIMNLLVAGFVYQQIPDFTLRFVIWVLSHTIYRVHHHGLNHIPEEGPALLVCNHVSYMDALVIAGAVKRPVRFVMDYRIFRIPVLGRFFRMAQTIPIGPREKAPATYSAALEQIDAELDAGNIVCIFPEGRLTTTGAVDTFRSGVETILHRRPVPVVPMALRGLWGSFFSHCGGPACSHWPRRFWSRIELIAGPPVAPENAAAERLHYEVTQLLNNPTGPQSTPGNDNTGSHGESGSRATN